MEMCYDGILVMPQNFSVVTVDEMEYIDGGLYLGYYDLVAIVATIGANPGSVASIAACAKTSAAFLCAKLGSMLGPVGWAIGGAVAVWFVTQAGVFAERTFSAIAKKKGVDFTIGWEWIVIPVLEGTIR
ncbi:MAG: hypothetical protein IJR95_03265 [Lachnospiraceae bacterium]|nr:hypothetical protein [Lachnospiraceae bacterium]